MNLILLFFFSHSCYFISLCVLCCIYIHYLKVTLRISSFRWDLHFLPGTLSIWDSLRTSTMDLTYKSKSKTNNSGYIVFRYFLRQILSASSISSKAPNRQFPLTTPMEGIISSLPLLQVCSPLAYTYVFDQLLDWSTWASQDLIFSLNYKH